MKIKRAAIRVGNTIFTGFDHGECFNQIPQELHNQNVEQGFVTDSNEFVDRKEAMIIARQANQITYDDGEKKTLISEDLHLNWLNEMNKELEELKQKAIVPKFEVGQEIYIVCDFNINRIVSGWKIADYEYYKQQYIVENKDSIDWIHEDKIFTTKEEAEQKLAEIKGEKGE